MGAAIGAVAVEVWVHKPHGIMFDNVLVVDDYDKAYNFGLATWKVRVDSEKAKTKAAEDKRKAEERAKKLADGNFFILMEEYTKIAAESLSAYPFVSFPAMLLLFFLIFKYCRGDRDKEEFVPRRRPTSKPAAKPVEKTLEKDDEKPLRQRKAAKEEAKEE